MDPFENKFDLHCANVHISFWLYKMCQMVATFSFVKFSPKLQEMLYLYYVTCNSIPQVAGVFNKYLPVNSVHLI